MSRNPYAAFVGNQDAEQLIRAFPEKLRASLAKLGPEGMARSLAPGKWTVAEILCHLADCEVAFSFRWRQTLAEDNHTAQPFDQNHWAKYYSTTPSEDALKTFLALRRWNCILLDQLSAGDWDRPVTHPERGELTFRLLVEMTAGHDLNHLQQLEKMAQETA